LKNYPPPSLQATPLAHALFFTCFCLVCDNIVIPTWNTFYIFYNGIYKICQSYNLFKETERNVWQRRRRGKHLLTISTTRERDGQCLNMLFWLTKCTKSFKFKNRLKCRYHITYRLAHFICIHWRIEKQNKI